MFFYPQRDLNIRRIQKPRLKTDDASSLDKWSTFFKILLYGAKHREKKYTYKEIYHAIEIFDSTFKAVPFFHILRLISF